MNKPLRIPSESESLGANSPLSIGELLVASGRLKREDIARVRHHQLVSKSGFGEAAVELGLVSNDDVRLALARHSNASKVRPVSTGLSPELVCAVLPDHPFATTVFRMRTALFLAHKKKTGPLMVAVVGAERGEGRSLLAANLAVAFAQVGARTIMVDGDMRHPRVHSLFNIANEGGLATALLGDDAYDDGVPVLAFEALGVMPAGGAANPQKLLSPVRFRSVMARLTPKNDVIVVDSPAWSSGSDAQLIAAETGLALLVTRMHTASRANVQALAQALVRNGTTTLAVPFN
ncbi:MAG: putative non-specific protein-tyrosine kinase EpsG-like protein [Variovorax sp.]|jgi:protein-tyrosine kinase|nr:putative non-specific protein-tyrosine kinase EpsG-like protein [Variovorax sp.]